MQGICYRTAWNWFHADKLPVRSERLPSGAIMVYPEETVESNETCVIYCRVSSHAQKESLERQRKRCEEFCLANGWKITSQVCEVASGMNDRRPKLIKLINSDAKRIVVEHKDRLTRFGFNYLEILLKRLGTEIVVINSVNDDNDDIIKDLVSIITSFCCRLYGLRRGRAKAKRIRDDVKRGD